MPEPTQQGKGGPGPAIFPTSTPWPSFGPPPVTAASITATVQSAPNAPSGPAEPDLVPVSTQTPTPEATSTQFAEESAINATPTPSPVPTATPLDRSGSFQPIMQYNYLVPDEWEAVVGSDVIVLEHLSGRARVTVRETLVDRSNLGSISEIANSLDPASFVDWTERSLSNIQVPGDETINLSYSGTKLEDPYLATVRWHLWGELLVEVTTEADAVLWASDSKLRNTALLVAASFAPQSNVPIALASEIENQLRARFGIRSSRIFSNTGSGLSPTELTCKQVFHDLLSEPVHVGSGVWQAFAIGDHGVQVWQILEPTFAIVPADHNTSIC